MAPEIIIALITAAGSIIAVILTNKSANNKMMNSMHTAQAVTDEKINELTREVREHNNFAREIPAMKQHLDDIDRRLDLLER